MGDFKRKNEIKSIEKEREQKQQHRSTAFTTRQSGRKNRTISCPVELWEKFAIINRKRGFTNSGSLTMLMDKYVQENADLLEN